jgi:Cys-tRNA(Pro)/Cys-tRNA(Cys) deacylase
MEFKTNVMRALDKAKIAYRAYDYTHTEAVSGADVAAALGQDPKRVFKTLVTIAKSRKNYVFVVPVEAELDLKKAAASVDEKAVAMIKSKELLPTTGYVHGGCSPIGMKKPFVTRLDASAAAFETIVFSAGKIGYQVELRLEDLNKIVPFALADLVASA